MEITTYSGGFVKVKNVFSAVHTGCGAFFAGYLRTNIPKLRTSSALEGAVIAPGYLLHS